MFVHSAKFPHLQECCGHLDAGLCGFCKAMGNIGVSSKPSHGGAVKPKSLQRVGFWLARSCSSNDASAGAS